MIKKKFLIILTIALLFVVGVNLNPKAKEITISFLNTLRSNYLYAIQTVKDRISEHFFQAEKIRELREAVKVLSKDSILLTAYRNKLNELLEENNLSDYNVTLQLVEALSYVRLNEFSKIWLEFPHFDKNRIYGLLYKGYSAGIVVEKYDKPMGLLQNDGKCSYSVYIGEKKIPGVIFGDRDKMVVKYIPPWFEPKKGEEVITSGLDRIFFEGVKVGKVVRVVDEKSYKSAIVEPYAKVEIPSFFHAIINQ